MILPKAESLIKIFQNKLSVKRDYRADITQYISTDEDLTDIAIKIISYIKELQFDENDEMAEIDPNIVKIAELEAKVMVYESVINSAGINLAIKPPKEEMGF